MNLPVLTSELEAHLKDRALWLRRTVLEMATRAKSGHITTAFSQAEILIALYHGGWLKHDPADLKWPERDRFILSKGQGGVGLYPVLADRGFFPRTELDDFAGVGNSLGVHAEWNVPGIEIVSGSLGHGLPIATGLATALKRAGNPAKIVVLLGDAELYEGSNWEAMLYAAQAKLGNIICIVDRNGLGTIGYTDGRARHGAPVDGPDLGDVGEKFYQFGFNHYTLHDGNDYAELWSGLEWAWSSSSSQPKVIVAKTKKGKGCTVFEDKKGWHYRTASGDDLVSCRRDLGLPDIGPSGPVSELHAGGY
ncbi:MAG: transketolase [Dehalococcoidia bacterium]|nr:transketolase [Dehalococcoidia bacterium]